MSDPLVSVICLCYNHERFVREAIESVLGQSYRNIEIIIVDDHSTDGSRAIISAIAQENPSIRFIANETNLGICAAFNRGWAHARGNFIIDFATDDVMLPERIARQVKCFMALDEMHGVVFTDAIYIDETGKPLRSHYAHLKRKGLLSAIPQGDVYRHVLSTYFICSPTMMTRREVFERLGGYDQNLAYEDFDFWVRSARTFRYAFLDEVTTKVRRTKASMSAGWYQLGDRQVHSTYLVCRKALEMSRSAGDRAALVKRLRFEVRQCVFAGRYAEAQLFYNLLSELGHGGGMPSLYLQLAKLKLPLERLRKLYHRWRYGV